MNSQYYDYSISAIGAELDEEKIKTALESLGLSEVLVEKLLNFDAYIDTLPDRCIDGFADRCDNEVRCWGNGGGDMSTETLLRDACRAAKTDNPRVIAKALYESIVDYTKKSFEAAGLVSTIIGECLYEE